MTEPRGARGAGVACALCVWLAAAAALLTASRAHADSPAQAVELSRLWIEPDPPQGALLLPAGAGRTGADLRGWDPGRFRFRQGAGTLSPFEQLPRLFPEGGRAFRLTLSERFAAGPLLASNVDADDLLERHPLTIRRQLVGGRASLRNFARAEVSGPLLVNRLHVFAQAYDDRSAAAPLGATRDEIASQPRYTLNLTWTPSPYTKVTLGGRFEGTYVENAGLSSWYLASAGRTLRSDQSTLVASAQHQIDPRNELYVTYDLVVDRRDARASSGLTVPAHYNLASFETWGNYPTTTRLRESTHRLDVHWSTLFDGLLFPEDAHTFTLGAQAERSARDEDVSRNGGFSFTDDASAGEAGSALAPVDPDVRRSWALFSSDRGDELHAKTVTTSLAAYAQDRIQLGSKLTVTPGVRFERFLGGPTAGPIVWRTSSLAPRVAVVWDVDGWTTLYANAGRHSQTLDASMHVLAREGAASSPLEYWDWTGDPQTVPDPRIDDARWQRARQFAPLVGRVGDIRHPYVDRLVTGVRREVAGAHLVASLRYEYRRYGDIVGIYDAGGAYDPRVSVTGPAPRDVFPFQDLRQGSRATYVIGNLEGARREYHSLNLSLQHDPFRWLTLRASLTWTFDRGNVESSYGLSTEWADPSGRHKSYGNMPGFDTWAARLGAAFDLPFRFSGRVDYWFYSGEYHSRVALVRPTNAPRTYVYDEAGRGGYLYPARQLVDVRLARDILRVAGGTLSASVQVFNLFNASTVLGVREPTAFFGSVRRLEAPREIHLGLRYDF